MQNFTFISINYTLFLVIIYVLLILLVLSFIVIACFAVLRRKMDLNKTTWEAHIAKVILQTIFLEDGDHKVDISNKFHDLLERPGFRRYMTNDLLKARGNFSGTSAINIRRLYEGLDLDRDSFRKLHALKWHIRAKGIQELGIMEQVKYRKEIFWLANDKHELVRNEAQGAMVSFFGYPGLSFLNVIEYPMSQWHQVQLLNKMSETKPESLADLKAWLRSTNESVIVFSIKLATLYNCVEVYSEVVNCIHSESLDVKISALEYLRQMPREDTPDLLIYNYRLQRTGYKLAVIDALKDIGTVKQISFLAMELDDQDDRIKAAAASSISILHPLGNTFFKTYLFRDQNPWKEIFLQITNNRVA